MHRLVKAPAIEIDATDTGSALSVRLAFHIREAAPERVFDFLTDPGSVPAWQSDARFQGQITPGPLHEGSLLDNRKRFLGYAFSTVTKVTAYARPARFAFRSDGPRKYTFTYRLAPDGGGTVVAVEAGFPRPAGLFRLIPRRFLSRAITEELTANHLRLKRILEAR